MNQCIGLAAHHPVGVLELAIFIFEVGSSSNSLALAEALIEPWLCNRGVDVTGGYKMRITKASNNMALSQKTTEKRIHMYSKLRLLLLL